jgi:molybdopterin-guanine dinucleotide biosynthesis protein A
VTVVAGAIIAGGRGRRLGGVDKGTLTLDGRTFLERQLAVLRPLFGRVLLVTAHPPVPTPEGVTLLEDRPPPGRGPLAGFEVALGALRADETAVVCVGGDMPLLQPAALQLLRDHAPDAPAVVPRINGFPEPLLARYGRQCLPAVTAALAASRLQTSVFAAAIPGVVWLEAADLRAVDPRLLSIENVNTPDDLERVQRLLDG